MMDSATSTMVPFVSYLVALAIILLVSDPASGAQAPTYPSLYSSTFTEPSPPNFTSEFRANFMQHKFNVDVNNIVAGFAYFSPSNGKIRLDGAYDGVLEASIFDYNNATQDGTVGNSVYSFAGGLTQGSCSSYFVAPALPLFAPDILNSCKAVYINIQHDDMYGPVSSWQFIYGGNVPATVYLDSVGTLVRIDFSSQNLRTFATTRFFNIIPGLFESAVFATPCG